MRYAVALGSFAVLALAGCGGSNDNPGGPSPDASNSVSVQNQALSNLSTVVDVAGADSDGPGWLVIHEDQGGTYGPAIGHTHVSSGTSSGVTVPLSRPAADGELLHAMLHVDAGIVGTYEFPGVDTAALDTSDALVVKPFTVTVPDGTPAVRLRVTSVGTSAYNFTAVEPTTFASTLGAQSSNESLLLESGRRYEIVNSASSGHPFEIIRKGANPSGDTILLSQASSGSLEADASVAWHHNGQTVRFTASAALQADANGYRCSLHPSTMRGNISFE